MDREMITGMLMLIVLLGCIIALIVLMVKKIIAKARGGADESAAKPPKKTKQKKVKKKKQKASIPAAKPTRFKKQPKKEADEYSYAVNNEYDRVDNDGYDNVDNTDNNGYDYADDYDHTVVLGRGGIYEEDNEATVIMRKEERSTEIQLVSDTDGRTYSSLCNDQIIIGRKPGCDIQIIGDNTVSGEHCVIRKVEESRFIVCDLNSSNGTYLNGSKVNDEEIIEDGDSLEIGRISYMVQIF